MSHRLREIPEALTSAAAAAWPALIVAVVLFAVT